MELPPIDVSGRLWPVGAAAKLPSVNYTSAHFAHAESIRCCQHSWTVL
jgi:hypothetical protein